MVGPLGDWQTPYDDDDAGDGAVDEDGDDDVDDDEDADVNDKDETARSTLQVRVSSLKTVAFEAQLGTIFVQ